MAHNLNQLRDGSYAYFGKDAAWHALGQVKGRFMTSAELLAEEAFQYSVFKSQLRDGLGRPVAAWGAFRWDHKDKLAGRKDAATFLAAVGKDYTIIPHDRGFQLSDALMATIDGAHYETAGVLGNGERVWALANLGLALHVGDDLINHRLLFVTSHDGSVSFQVRTCAERVVCQNTWDIAMSEKTRNKLVVRHTKNASSKLDDMQVVLSAMRDDAAKVEDKLNFLAGRKLTREAFDSVAERLFPKQKKQTTDGPEELVDTTRRTNILSDILKIYELNDGNAFPEQRGSAYNLFNAVTNYVDHERSSKGGNRAESVLFGSGSALKSKAFDVIWGIADELPAMPKQYTSISVPSFSELGLNVPELIGK